MSAMGGGSRTGCGRRRAAHGVDRSRLDPSRGSYLFLCLTSGLALSSTVPAGAAPKRASGSGTSEGRTSESKVAPIDTGGALEASRDDFIPIDEDGDYISLDGPEPTDHGPRVAPVAPAATAIPATANPADRPSTTPTGPDSGGSGPPAMAWLALGAGAGALGVGTAFLLKSNSSVDSGNELYTRCETSGVCAQNTRDQISADYESARSARVVSVVGLSVGGVGVAAGVAMLLFGSSDHPTSSARLEPWVGPRSVGLTGSF